MAKDEKAIEWSIGPHPARYKWRVLRVNFPPTERNNERVRKILALCEELEDESEEKRDGG